MTCTPAYSCSHSSIAGAFQLGTVCCVTLVTALISLQETTPVYLHEELAEITGGRLFEKGTQKFIPRCKCLNSGDDYVEK
jgi:hypothetical protein